MHIYNMNGYQRIVENIYLPGLEAHNHDELFKSFL